MTYTVKVAFFDLADGKRFYQPGDVYPRPGYEPTALRLETLLNANNPKGQPFIEVAADGESLEDLTLSQLKDLAADRGLEVPSKIKKEDLLALLNA